MLQIDVLDVKQKDISGSKFQEVKADNLEFDNVSLTGTSFNNVNLSKLSLNDVNLSHTKITDANLVGTTIAHANLSHMEIDHVHLYGSHFRNIVTPLVGDPNYTSEGYSPITFEACNLKS